MMRRALRATWWWLVPLALVGSIGCSGDDDDDDDDASNPPVSPSPGTSPTPVGDDDDTTTGDDDDTTTGDDDDTTTGDDDDTTTGDDDDTTTGDDDDDTGAPAGPSITITAPPAGSVTQPFTVEVEVANFTLNPDAVGGAAVDGEGHWHLNIDGVYYNFSATTTLVVDGLAPGDHELQAQLVQNDHLPLDPDAVSQTVTVTVGEATANPSITITAPGDGTEQKADFAVNVDIQDFTLSNDVGGVPVEGEGHWHLNIDGEYYNYSTSSSLAVAIADLSPGSHTLQAQLVNNDHSPLIPNVVSNTVTIDVPAQPSISIVDPLDGNDVSFPFTVTVDVENFTLDPDAVGGGNVEGHGHWHLEVDGEYHDYSADPTLLVDSLTPGMHTLRARLVNNNHTDLSPAVVSEEVSIFVPEPSIEITYPTGGTVSPNFTVFIDVENFFLNPDAIGGEPMPGQGHWHLFIDGVYYDFSASTSSQVQGLSLGEHTLVAELVQNDHESLDPQVYSNEVTITVANEPSITITSPLTGEVGFPFTVTVDIQNFLLEPDAVGGAPEEGHGHWHLNIDGEYYDFSATETLEVDSLTPGTHTLQAQLVNNDHSPLDPDVVSNVVTVTIGEPDIEITSPADGSSIAGDVELTVDVDNFVFDPNVGGSNVPGHGHYHIYVNGEYDGASSSPTYVITDLETGNYQIEVRLAENDHNELSPRVNDIIELSVTEVDETAPRITLVSPANASELHSSSVEIEVEVENFVLDPEAVGGSNVQGRGHYHILLNGEYYNFSAETTALITDLPPGPHAITVQLVNNDHSPIDPEVSDTAQITVPENAPRVSIGNPTNGTVLSGDSFQMGLTIENFTLNPDAVGLSPVEGEGHYHVFIDGEYYNYFASTTAQISGLEPGDHDIAVELVNNDHSSLEPPVIDTVFITMSDEGGENPSVTVTADPTTVAPGGEVDLSIGVTNYVLQPPGTNNILGYGHYNVYLDEPIEDNLLATDYLEEITVVIPDDVVPGSHQIIVELRTDDGFLYFPETRGQTQITVSTEGESTLYERLGGEEGITLVIQRMLGHVLEDSKINAYFLNAGTDLGHVETCLIKQVGHLTGGPQTYPDEELGCRDMATAHAGLGISTQDYNDLADHLVEALTFYGVSSEDITTIAGVLLADDFKSDIIEDVDGDDTIYQRLGRKPGIEGVIGDFIGRVVSDPKINGYFLNDDLDPARLSTCLVNFVCAGGEGPCAYGQESELQDTLFKGEEFVPCQDMLSSHAGLGISTNDYNDLVQHLVDALNQANALTEDINALGSILGDESFIDDIVEDFDSDDTMYQRVGRKEAIEAVIDVFIGKVVSDASLVGFFTSTNADRLHTCLTSQVCGIDGPCSYGHESELQTSLFVDEDTFVACLDMETVHEGSTNSQSGGVITIDDFNALVGHLVVTMNEFELDTVDMDIILGALGPLCPQIVADPSTCG